MIPRWKQDWILQRLQQFPAVALVGCRQVGKTTLAREIAQAVPKEAVYLDLQRFSDLAKLKEPELYLKKQAGKLVILDEIHLVPELFRELRSLIDERRSQGEKHGHFLLLGSASLDLLKQTSESLAGRVSFIELDPFGVAEAKWSQTRDPIDRLWVRGGFPDSFLAETEAQSLQWRQDFLTTYLRRDLPDLGINLPPERVHRLLRMLALDQGCAMDLTKLASNLSVSTTIIRKYLDTLTELFLIRPLRPWNGNSKKRLVKTPKFYVRDSGLLHALVGIRDEEDLFGHPIYGMSWEGFVIEQILQRQPFGTEATFYRTGAGAEIDLVLEIPGYGLVAMEIKRTLSPKISKGFHLGCEDIQPDHRYFVIPTAEAFPLDPYTEAIGIGELLERCNRS